MFRAAVLQIIACHSGNDDVGFERERFGGADRAKAARTSAAVARNHERRRAFAPAFPMVRALRAFADGVQLQLVEQAARARETVRHGQRDAQPFRQTRTRFQFSRSHLIISIRRLRRFSQKANWQK